MRRSILLVPLLSVSAAACAHSWEPQYGPAPQVLAAHSGESVIVVQKTGARVTLKNAQVAGDSVVGQAGSPPVRTAIAVADVQVVTVRRTRGSMATGVAIGVAAGVVAVLVGTLAFLEGLGSIGR